MPGLELIGPLAGNVRVPSQNELEQGFEEYGMIIAGDARDVPQFSGMELGSRWLCRAQGPATELLHDWPTPNAETWRYHPSEEAARTMYQQLRGHLFQRFPGVVAQDAREMIGLNVPTAMAESFFQNGTEVLRLFYDRMADLQIAVRNTNCIRRFSAHPAALDGPALVSYYSQNDVFYLAIARGPTGAAQHVCVIYAPQHRPQQAIAEGMPRAEAISERRCSPIQLTSGFLIAFWGRASGGHILAPAQGQDPAQMLHAYLGQNVAAPLSTNVPGLDARLPAPAAYAVRVEPGEWTVDYYEMDARAGEGYSFLCLSKKGAPSFQPYVPGNAGGRMIGGMALDRYAMMTAERERILMQFGANAGAQLAALCQKYGQPVPQGPMGVNTGYAARIVDWDLAIQGDPKLSSEFLAQKMIAGYRLSGVEPTPEMIAQIRAQQDQTAQMLSQAAQANDAARKELSEGALKLIELARRETPPQLVESAKKLFPNEMRKANTPAYGFYKAISILKNPGGENPRVPAVDMVTEKLARAHWLCMTPDDQRSEGSEKSYVKDVIADVYEKHGLQVPGVGGFLSKLMDKLLPSRWRAPPLAPCPLPRGGLVPVSSRRRGSSSRTTSSSRRWCGSTSCSPTSRPRGTSPWPSCCAPRSCCSSSRSGSERPRRARWPGPGASRAGSAEDA